MDEACACRDKCNPSANATARIANLFFTSNSLQLQFTVDEAEETDVTHGGGHITVVVVDSGVKQFPECHLCRFNFQ
jgi:hypothetical protein